MKPSTTIPLDKACRGSNLSDPPRGKSFLLIIFLGLALLLLVGCAGASIIAEPDPSRPPAGGGEAAKTGLVEPSSYPVSESSPNPVADSRAPAGALVQQSDKLGDGRPVGPASIPTVENAAETAGEKSVPASPAPAGPEPVASDVPSGDVSSGDNPSGAPQSEPDGATAVKENPAEVSSQPTQKPLEAPATGTEDTYPPISLPLAPAFTLTSASGETISVETYRGKSNVVLVFFRGFW